MQIVHYLQGRAPRKVNQHEDKTHPGYQESKVPCDNFGHGLFPADYMAKEELKDERTDIGGTKNKV